MTIDAVLSTLAPQRLQPLAQIASLSTALSWPQNNMASPTSAMKFATLLSQPANTPSTHLLLPPIENQLSAFNYPNSAFDALNMVALQKLLMQVTTQIDLTAKVAGSIGQSLNKLMNMQ